MERIQAVAIDGRSTARAGITPGSSFADAGPPKGSAIRRAQADHVHGAVTAVPYGIDDIFCHDDAGIAVAEPFGLPKQFRRSCPIVEQRFFRGSVVAVRSPPLAPVASPSGRI